MNARPFFLPGARERRAHRPATTTTKTGSGSIAPAYIAGGTLILLAGCSTEAVLSLIEGHWASAGACVVSFGLTLVFYGFASRRCDHKRTAPVRRRRAFVVLDGGRA